MKPKTPILILTFIALSTLPNGKVKTKTGYRAIQ